MISLPPSCAALVENGSMKVPFVPFTATSSVVAPSVSFTSVPRAACAPGHTASVNTPKNTAKEVMSREAEASL